MSESGYGSGALCGDCLHHKNCHSPVHGELQFAEIGVQFLYCSACGKMCDGECFNKKLKASKIVIMNDMRINLGSEGLNTVEVKGEA